MALILNIDTAQETAGVYLGADGHVLASLVNDAQKDHATWIHHAIENLLVKAAVDAKQLQAIAVTAGPGSYTGLRVGMATAKGLCYAWGLPLITESTLRVMAAAYYAQVRSADWVCPLIDARRMEVFTAVYDAQLTEQVNPQAMVLEATSFSSILSERKLVFFGSGMVKWKGCCLSPHAVYHSESVSSHSLVPLAEQSFKEGKFTSLAYAEPAYLKAFYAPTKIRP